MLSVWHIEAEILGNRAFLPLAPLVARVPACSYDSNGGAVQRSMPGLLGGRWTSRSSALTVEGGLAGVNSSATSRKVVGRWAVHLGEMPRSRVVVPRSRNTRTRPGQLGGPPPIDIATRTIDQLEIP